MAANAQPANTYSTGSLIREKLSPFDQVRLFENKYDPLSVDVIKNLPIGQDARCLELGAGAGSMAYWLAGWAGRGSVLAVDIDPGYLDATRAANLTVRQMDITREEFAPESFDLIHARALFEHLPRRDDLLASAMRWLVPGGWLVVADFYYLPSADAPGPVGRELVGGYVRRLEEQGADMRWARGLPASLTRIGLGSVGARVTPAGPGQSAADDELIGLRLRQEGHTLVEGGHVTAGQLAEFIASLDRGEAWDITTLAITAWGQRPAS
jgi:SAM-dependent methyltransferase